MSLNKIKQIYEEYINDNSYVYKNCQNEYIIIMKKLDDTKTNESRYGITDFNNAKFRADKLLVVLIFKINQPKEQIEFFVNKFRNSEIRYQKGEIVLPDEFDDDLDEVCSNGIHYFKTIDRAFYYTMPDNYTGKWINYYDHGLKSNECEYLRGKENGKRKWKID